MLKVIISIFITTASAIVSDGSTKRAFAECAAPSQGIYNSIISKIEDSSIAKPNELSCTEKIEINSQDPNDMLITTGRKRGKYTICLSDDSSNPCKYVMGIFNESKIPSDMLSEIFNITKTKQTQLNETVERLFFKPSLLID